MRCLGTIVLSDITGWPWDCPKITMFIHRIPTGTIQLRQILMPPIVVSFAGMFEYLPNGKREVVLDSMLHITE